MAYILHKFKDEELHWGFEADTPYFNSLKSEERHHTHQIHFHPFPCYSHDEELVKSILEKNEKILPTDLDAYYYIMGNDTKDGTNAYCYKVDHWNEPGREEKGNPYPFSSHIVLYGKRIPIHPSVTKYLVSHETGHHIEYYIRFKLGYEDRDKFLKEYAEVRRIDYSEEYGGRRWHKNTGEIFANDVRILLFEDEVDFWPHPHLTNPLQTIGLKEWFDATIKKVREV